MSKEVLWRGEKKCSNNDWETNNYPPSLYGKALINPTHRISLMHSLIRTDILSACQLFTVIQFYANRDPRLAAYVVLNGGQVGVNNTAINTAADATDSKDNTKQNKDGINHFSGSSTYYVWVTTCVSYYVRM